MEWLDKLLTWSTAQSDWKFLSLVRIPSESGEVIEEPSADFELIAGAQLPKLMMDTIATHIEEILIFEFNIYHAPNQNGIIQLCHTNQQFYSNSQQL